MGVFWNGVSVMAPQKGGSQWYSQRTLQGISTRFHVRFSTQEGVFDALVLGCDRWGCDRWGC